MTYTIIGDKRGNSLKIVYFYRDTEFDGEKKIEKREMK